jgi:phthalate 4,5-dioxygenase
MLSHEDNERLVRVGKGTPLGELFRLYWIPFLPSAINATFIVKSRSTIR